MNKTILDPINYTFDASAKTIVFTESCGVIPLRHILIITNITDNTIIYNFGCEGFGGDVSGLTLTLDYDTTTMSDSDELQVIIHTEASDIEKSILNSLEIQSETLSCLQNILSELKEQKQYIKEILR
jgi:hypothetical protein